MFGNKTISNSLFPWKVTCVSPKRIPNVYQPQNPKNPKFKSQATTMEDSFKLRVDRVFGSLSTSTSENLNSLWSLTDDEIERKEWNRDKDEPEAEAQPNAFFANLRDKKPDSWLGEELEKDILDLDDGLDEEETEACDSLGSSSRSAASARGEDYNDEEWEIKSKIGADCTLDNEVIITSLLLVIDFISVHLHLFILIIRFI